MRWNHAIAFVLVALAGSDAFSRESQQSELWDTLDFSINGHIKYRYVNTHFPDDSLFRELSQPQAQDHGADLRLNFRLDGEHWDFQAAYQFNVLYADTLELSRDVGGTPLQIAGIPDDKRRWWDLTHVIQDEGQRAMLHRLDRISIGFTTDNTAWRFGRQAVSWGNGLVYTPMDIFNPFDPVAVDKEYKSGDDMLYGQLLRANGDDLQAVAIVRRDPLTGDVESKQGSLAFKYHGFAGFGEYDLLAATHYDDTVLGLGVSADICGAVWSGDLTWTDSDTDDVFSAVAGVTHAWTWGGHNVTGLLEVYYNGFGLRDGKYDSASFLDNPALLERLARGELFTLGRRYAVASATIELNPLLIASPSLFTNLDDPSALLQLTLQYDWLQNLQLLGSINIPIGPSGTEFGGIQSPVDGRYLSTGAGLFVQLAGYF